MKRILKAAALGAVIGLAANQLVSYLTSAALQLGYFMAYPANLPERVGGEMNAVLCQMAFFALLGMGVGLCVSLARRSSARGGRRLLLLVPISAASVMPAAVLAACLLG